MALPDDGSIPNTALKGLAELAAAAEDEAVLASATGDLQVLIDDGTGGELEVVAEDVDVRGRTQQDREPDPEKKADDADSDDDDSQYSSRVQKRIQREAKLKREAREEAAKEKERADNLERELGELRGKKAAEDIDAKLAAAKEKYKQARLDVDFDAEAEAQSEIAELTARRLRAQEAPAEPVAQPKADEKANPLVESWKGRNAWFSKPEYRRQAVAAIAINNDLIAEGYRDSDPDFYRELDVRIRDTIKLPATALPSRETPVDSGLNDGTVSTSGGSKPGRIVLSQSDLANMRRFGLDPSNKAHLQQYAKEKASR